MKRKIFFVCVLAIVTLLCQGNAVFACEGARPLAMGGAFTGLADDANATYWNPAAMGVMEGPEITYTGTVYNRDIVNYDDWVSVVVPMKFSPEDDGVDFGSIGLSFMSNIDRRIYGDIFNNISRELEQKYIDRWYTLSYGRELAELVEGLCVGANFRYATYEIFYTGDATVTKGGKTYSDGDESSDSSCQFDVSAYYKWQGFSIGFLYQDINEAEVTLFEDTAKYKANFRPGIAYCFDDRYTLTAELYDAFDNCDSLSVRFGGEAKITNNIALRLGAYSMGSSNKTQRAFTSGLGLLSGDLFGDRITVSIDYGVMYWYESESNANVDKFTHFVGGSIKF